MALEGKSSTLTSKTTTFAPIANFSKFYFISPLYFCVTLIGIKRGWIRKQNGIELFFLRCNHSIIFIDIYGFQFITTPLPRVTGRWFGKLLSTDNPTIWIDCQVWLWCKKHCFLLVYCALFPLPEPMVAG